MVPFFLWVFPILKYCFVYFQVAVSRLQQIPLKDAIRSGLFVGSEGKISHRKATGPDADRVLSHLLTRSISLLVASLTGPDSFMINPTSPGHAGRYRLISTEGQKPRVHRVKSLAAKRSRLLCCHVSSPDALHDGDYPSPNEGSWKERQGQAPADCRL